MIDVWSLTQTALSGLGWALAAGQYIPLTGSPLPDQFMVYALVDGVPDLWADNAETDRTYRMQVNLYSRTGLSTLPDVNGAMITAGWTAGPVREIPYNPDTRHYGLVMEFYYSSGG